MFYLGYFYMIWWSVVVALIVGALCERTDWVQQVWMPYSYLYMMFSGFFYLADWLPPSLRNVALYQPYTQAYEIIRHGDYDLWRPSVYHVRPRNLDFVRVVVDARYRKYVVIE